MLHAFRRASAGPAAATQPRLDFLLIGQGLVLAGALERVRSRGHRVSGILATSAAEAALMRGAGLPMATPDSTPAGFVAANGCDILLSCNNLHVLDAVTLARPRIAAINFHNAPLPAYAGLRATTWAILNAEATHGITWHRMEAGIDTGPVVLQRCFALAADETTATLDARCTAEALASLDALFDVIERGDVAGSVQAADKRTYYGRSAAIPNAGRIDWNWTVDRALRLVRACDWGDYPNDFGHATVAMPDGAALVVRSAQAADGGGLPGTVVSVDATSLVVACSNGCIRCNFVQPHGLEVGFVLPAPGTGAASVSTATPTSTLTSTLTSTSGSTSATPVALLSVMRSVSPRASATPSGVLAMLAEQAAADPHAPAIDDGQRVITRGELAQRAHALAAGLVAAGLRPESGVGVLLPAGADFVAAAFGAMLAAGAYVPLHVGTPSQRRAVELVEAGVTHVVVAQHDAMDSVLPGVAVVAMDDVPVAVNNVALPAVASDACAYRIFTSGSTGRPKAVEITHAALTNLVHHYHGALSMRSSDRMTLLAHPTFDASVADTWPILAAGGTLLVPPLHVLRDPPVLIEWLANSRSTCTFVPTAIAARLLRLPWPQDIALRVLLAGGDVLHQRPPPGLSFKLINSYGPTENTVDSLWSCVEPGAGQPTIGVPIAGVTAAVVDTEGNTVARGVMGELVLGGAQVARGYRGRPELTAEKFIPDPAFPGRKRYRTGDRVRITASGEYEFHGRIDRQVQLRGIRVEPGEIEAVLMSDARVQDAACVPERLDGEVTALVVHVATRAGIAHDAALVQSLRGLLAAHLPPAITPRAMLLRDDLPRNAAGKIDYAALVPKHVVAEVQEVDAPTARSAALTAIDAAWYRVLRHAAHPASPATLTDSATFWTLGGDSLGAIDLLLAVEQVTQVRVPMGHFLACPTLAGLKAMVASGATTTIVELHAGEGIPLVLWYGLSGDLEVYRHLAGQLGERPVLGVMSPAVASAADAPATIEEAAAAGLAALRHHGITDAPALLGFSWGGLLAFEAARQLAMAGTPAPFVGVIGTVPPTAARARLARITALLRFGTASLYRRMRHRRPTWQRFTAACKRVAWLLGPGGAQPMITDGSTPLRKHHVAAGYRYRPTVTLPIRLNLFRDVESRDYVTNVAYFEFDKPDIGWSAWTGTDVTVHWLEGNHRALMQPASARAIACEVNAQLCAVMR